MLETYKTSVSNQYGAALCAMNTCIHQCPDDQFNAVIRGATFSQLAFHTLFYTDYYLGKNEDALRLQSYHQEYPDFFRDYEELEHVDPVGSYKKSELLNNARFCYEKAKRKIASESSGTLTADCDFDRRDCSRAELHMYNIRHIQHHVGQLSMRLRIDAGNGAPWIDSGWKDPQ